MYKINELVLKISLNNITTNLLHKKIRTTCCQKLRYKFDICDIILKN